MWKIFQTCTRCEYSWSYNQAYAPKWVLKDILEHDGKTLEACRECLDKTVHQYEVIHPAPEGTLSVS